MDKKRLFHSTAGLLSHAVTKKAPSNQDIVRSTTMSSIPEEAVEAEEEPVNLTTEVIYDPNESKQKIDPRDEGMKLRQLLQQFSSSFQNLPYETIDIGPSAWMGPSFEGRWPSQGHEEALRKERQDWIGRVEARRIHPAQVETAREMKSSVSFGVTNKRWLLEAEKADEMGTHDKNDNNSDETKSASSSSVSRGRPFRCVVSAEEARAGELLRMRLVANGGGEAKAWVGLRPPPWLRRRMGTTPGEGGDVLVGLVGLTKAAGKDGRPAGVCGAWRREEGSGFELWWALLPPLSVENGGDLRQLLASVALAFGSPDVTGRMAPCENIGGFDSNSHAMRIVGFELPPEDDPALCVFEWVQ